LSVQTRKLFALLLATIMFFSCFSVLGSSELDKKMEEWQRIEREMAEKEQQLKDVKAREKSVMNELEAIEYDLQEAETELEKLERQLSAVRRSIVVVQGELKEAEANVELRNDLLGRRIRAIHENGTVSYLEVLLSATSFADFVNRYELLQQIIRADVVILEEVREEKALIEEKKKELEEKRSEITRLTNAAASQKRTIEVRASDRERALEQLQSDKEAYEKALDDLEAKSKQLEKVIRDLQAKNNQNPPSAGSYIWPVKGRITSPFGMRYHPVLKTYRMHTGIDIAASSGTSVKAANSGTVLSSGWMGAYGYAVIIDHGGGISTLYAHHSANLVQSGDKVLRGDAIARVGSTGLSTGPHLHFEVRVKGVPDDPMKWLP
jgi:murein DD-endopeptidase MepM/ murein hydrolase activator NlpD